MLCAVLLTAGSASVEAQSSAAGGGLWKGLRVVDLSGHEWTQEQLLGSIVLLDFWATWCAPCLEEVPNLKRIHRELGGRGVKVMGVALDSIDRHQLNSWLRRHEVDWAQIHDPRGVRGELARRFSVEAVPRTAVIDPAGRLVALDLRGDALFTVLRDLAESQHDERTRDEDIPR